VVFVDEHAYGFVDKVVDRNEASRADLVRDLTEWSMRVAGTADSASGTTTLRRAALAGRPFDLVIHDVGTARDGGLGPV
jgi:hypothetical protein